MSAELELTELTERQRESLDLLVQQTANALAENTIEYGEQLAFLREQEGWSDEDILREINF